MIILTAIAKLPQNKAAALRVPRVALINDLMTDELLMTQPDGWSSIKNSPSFLKHVLIIKLENHFRKQNKKTNRWIFLRDK